MENLFENCYTMSKERYISWAKNPVKKNKLKLIWIVLTFFIAMTMLQAFLSHDFLLLPFYLVLIVFCLYRCFFQNRVLFIKQYKANAASQGKREWERIIKLSDCIHVEDGNIEVQYQWDQVKEYFENKDDFIIVFKNGSGIRLDKKGFVKGTYEEFLVFINNKFDKIIIK
jgi:hypothetical protein